MKNYLPSLLVFLSFSTLCAQDELKKKTSARWKVESASVEFDKAVRSGNKKKIQEARLILSTAEQMYALASRKEFQSRLNQRMKRNQEGFVYQQLPELERRKQAFQKSAVKMAKQLKGDKSEAMYKASVSKNAAIMKMILMDEEMTQSYVRRYKKTDDRHWVRHRQKGRKVTAKVSRMEALLDRVTGNNFNESFVKGAEGRQMEKAIKKARFDRDYAEYRRLANQEWVDARSGKSLSPDLQSKARANALLALERSVKARSYDGGVPESFVKFFTAEKKDSRLNTARMLEAERSNDISRGYLQHLEGKQSSPKTHFRAMAQAIHKKKATLEGWYANEYLPNANDGKDHVLKQWFNVGMGTARRSIMPNSEEGINTVRRRLDATLANADEAAAALAYAGKHEARDFSNFSGLTEQEKAKRISQRDLLLNYGMLEKVAGGKLRYKVPSSTRKLNQVTDVRLPKSPWLDAVSVKSTAITGVSMMTGSGAAAFSQKIATLGNVSQRGAKALTILSEVTASSAMDGLINKAEGRDANLDQALLQNLTMSGLGKLGKGASDSFLNRNKMWREAIENTGKNNIAKELKDVIGGPNRGLSSAAMKRFIASSAGLSSEASIDTLYQATLNGGPLDKEAFLANLASGAMSKTAGRVLRGGSKGAKERFYKALPEGVRQWVRDHPEVAMESFERARKSNAIGKLVLSRFEAVKRSADDQGGFGFFKRKRSDAELVNDPAFADHVAKSLIKGEMRWSDLGVLAEKKGSTISPLLEAVKQRRTKWSYGVDEPSDVATRERATKLLKDQFDKDLATIKRTAETPRERNVAALKLEREYLTTVDQLGTLQRSDSDRGKQASKMMEKARGQLFNEAVMSKGVGKEVIDLAKRTLSRQLAHERKTLEANPERLSSAEIKRRTEALNLKERVEMERISKTKMIAPGSSDPTSDIDRSWDNPRVVRAMKKLQRDRLLLENNGVKGIGSTTAKTWDLNEYYNVMDGVKASMSLRNDSEKGFNNETINYKGVGNVSHDDVVAGNSRAAAMAHMDAEHKALYKRNVIQAAHGESGNPTKVEQVKRELAIADLELEGSQKRLSRARKKVAAVFNLDPNSKEVEIYARDKIYGEAMQKVKQLDNEIALLDEGSEVWKKKQSQRERLMNRASRDGIEAYTDGAGLDIIVNRMQQKRNQDGKKMSVDQLMNDPNFTRKGDLSQFSERQLDNMMNDQVMMISEHLNAYQKGEETPFQTARALAKYTQRSALVDKMNGKALPDGHPMKELYKAATELVKHKGNPEAMMAALKDFAGPGGSARDGLRKLVKMTQGAIPGFKGYTSVKPKKEAVYERNAPKGFSSLNSYKEWLRTRDRVFEEGGKPAVNRWLRAQRSDARSLRESLVVERMELSRLNEKYLPEDFQSARRLEDELESLIMQLDSLPRSLLSDQPFKDLADRKAAIEAKLNALEERRDAYVAAHGKPPENDDLVAIVRELAFVDSLKKMLDGALENGSTPPELDKLDALLADDETPDEESAPENGITPKIKEEFKKLR